MPGIGRRDVAEVGTTDRRRAFKAVADGIMDGRADRARWRFGSDTKGEIARALEWAFRGGERAAGKAYEATDQHPHGHAATEEAAGGVGNGPTAAGPHGGPPPPDPSCAAAWRRLGRADKSMLRDAMPHDWAGGRPDQRYGYMEYAFAYYERSNPGRPRHAGHRATHLGTSPGWPDTAARWHAHDCAVRLAAAGLLTSVPAEGGGDVLAPTEAAYDAYEAAMRLDAPLTAHPLSPVRWKRPGPPPRTVRMHAGYGSPAAPPLDRPTGGRPTLSATALEEPAGRAAEAVGQAMGLACGKVSRKGQEDAWEVAMGLGVADEALELLGRHEDGHTHAMARATMRRVAGSAQSKGRMLSLRWAARDEDDTKADPGPGTYIEADGTTLIRLASLAPAEAHRLDAMALREMALSGQQAADAAPTTRWTIVPWVFGIRLPSRTTPTAPDMEAAADLEDRAAEVMARGAVAGPSRDLGEVLADLAVLTVRTALLDAATRAGKSEWMRCPAATVLRWDAAAGTFDVHAVTRDRARHREDPLRGSSTAARIATIPGWMVAGRWAGFMAAMKTMSSRVVAAGPMPSFVTPWMVRWKGAKGNLPDMHGLLDARPNGRGWPAAEAADRTTDGG